MTLTQGNKQGNFWVWLFYYFVLSPLYNYPMPSYFIFFKFSIFSIFQAWASDVGRKKRKNRVCSHGRWVQQEIQARKKGLDFDTKSSLVDWKRKGQIWIRKGGHKLGLNSRIHWKRDQTTTQQPYFTALIFLNFYSALWPNLCPHEG